MSGRTRSLVAVLLIVPLLLTNAGCCTLIGLGAGALADHHRPHGPVPPERWNRLPPGRMVEITQVDGTKTFESPGADSSLHSVPREQIASVVIPSSHTGVRIGGLAGLAIDVMWVAALVAISQSDGILGGGGWAKQPIAD